MTDQLPDTDPADLTAQPSPDAESLRSIGWLRRLVAIDTTSRNSNLELIELVADEVRKLGLEPHVLPGEEEGKANLVVTVPAHDGTTTGGLLVSGHTDVVPVDGQNWDSDPFEVREDEGRLYGRGVADMKGFIAVALSTLPRFAESRLANPLHVALSYDEEVGCIGGEVLMRQLQELGLSPQAAIVGEPTSMEVVASHKSMNVVRLRFTGVPGHSSAPAKGVNAIEHAAEMVLHLRSIADAWRHNGPFDDGYAVPYSTLVVSMANGGTAQNIVPGTCDLTFEFRTIAEVDPEGVIASVRSEAERIGARMQRENPAAGVDVAVLAHVPSLAEGNGTAAGVAAELGAVPDGPKVSYGTEAGQFQGIGVDTVVCGPGDIAQAHTPNEWVEISQLAACEQFFDAMLERLRA